MPHYRVFGRRLRSDLVFPELEEDKGLFHSVDLVLEAVTNTPPPHPSTGTAVGELTVGKGVRVHLYRSSPRSLILTFEDTGTFEITADRIRWWPGPTNAMEPSRVDAKGRAIPLALHLSGLLCLHAGAARVAGGALAFAGPKRVGKSTLTAALVARGASFLTDDVLAVDSGRKEPIAYPGFGAFRLWADSVGEVSLSTDYRAPGLGGKLNLRAPPPPNGRGEKTRMTTLYLLSPASAEEAETATRRQLSESEATMAILANIKNVELLGGIERAPLFERAAELAGSIPVYELRIPRDLTRIGETAELILEWHQGAVE